MQSINNFNDINIPIKHHVTFSRALRTQRSSMITWSLLANFVHYVIWAARFDESRLSRGFRVFLPRSRTDFDRERVWSVSCLRTGNHFVAWNRFLRSMRLVTIYAGVASRLTLNRCFSSDEFVVSAKVFPCFLKCLHAFCSRMLHYPASGHQKAIAGIARKIVARRAISLAWDIRMNGPVRHDRDVTSVPARFTSRASAMIVTSRQSPRNFTPTLARRASRKVHGLAFFIFFSSVSIWPLEDCQVCFSRDRWRRPVKGSRRFSRVLFASAIECRECRIKYERLF